MSHLLDSVILIDHLNGFPAATDFIRKHARSIHISPITRAEVLAGCTDQDAPAGMALLDQFLFLPMDIDIADEAARIRRRTRLKLPDAIQAAFAVRHRLKLVTRNTKEFPADQFSFVTVPYRLP